MIDVLVTVLDFLLNSLFQMRRQHVTDRQNVGKQLFELRNSLARITENARRIAYELEKIIDQKKPKLDGLFDSLEMQANEIKRFYELLHYGRLLDLMGVYKSEMGIHLGDVINERENILIFIAYYPFISTPKNKRDRVLKILKNIHFKRVRKVAGSVYGTGLFWPIVRQLEDYPSSLASLHPTDLLKTDWLEEEGIIQTQEISVDDLSGLKIILQELRHNIVSLEQMLGRFDDFIKAHFEMKDLD